MENVCRKRNIHIIRGREVMSIRRCACFVVYTCGVSPTHIATQTVNTHCNPNSNKSISWLFHNSLFGLEGSYIECSCSRTKQRKKLVDGMIHIYLFSLLTCTYKINIQRLSFPYGSLLRSYMLISIYIYI